MPVARRRVSVSCVLLALLAGVLLVVTWTLRGDPNGRHKIRIPSQRFWRKLVPSKSFWNREQQRLDLLSNPVVWSDGELPDWVNDTGPADPCEPDFRVPRQILDYNTLPGRFQDFLLHMRCRSYPLLIDQPAVCSQAPFLLFAVKSLIPHFERRQAIRETWGRAGVLANRTVATVFLLGSTVPSDHHPDLQGMLRHEGALHGDLIQWDYRDSFFNLTLKEVLFLRWFSQNCSHATFVFKGDDDVFVNTWRILQFLGGLTETASRDLFVGDVISNAGPHRNRKLKYFIPDSVFSGFYPPYAGGGGYLYSGDLALRLANASQQVVLYPIDDVYTGMCLKKLGLAPQRHPGFRTFGIDPKSRNNPCAYRGLMLVHSLTPQELLSVWPWVADPELTCQ